MILLQTTIPRFAPFTACKPKAGRVSRLLWKRSLHRPVIPASLPQGHDEKGTPSNLDKACRLAVSGVLASGLLWLSPEPVQADMQMVSPQMVTQMARPLPKQAVDKGKIWTIFIGGAVLLFGVTVVAENNESFFPAISRANRAFRVASKQMDEIEERQKKEEELLRLRQAEFDEQQRQMALVQHGMKEAKAKVLSGGSGPLAAGRAAEAAAGGAPAAPALEPEHSSEPAAVAQAEGASSDSSGASTGSSSIAGYVVVEDAVPDMGAIAWPAITSELAAPAEAVTSTSAHAEEALPPAANGTPGGAGGAAAVPAVTAEEEAEAAARLARLQGFVSGTMAAGKSPLEAYKAHRQ